MDKQRFVRKVVAASVLAAFGASGMALADAEMEPNHPMSSAQKLVITSDLATGKGGATVTGAITHGTQPDVDFYSFYAEAGDVITLDIDGTNGLDSYLTLFGPGFSWPLENDDAGLLSLDEGSSSYYDSMLLNVAITQSGTYTVAVTAYGTTLSPSGTYDTTWVPDTSGAYTLVLSGVSLPPVAEPTPTPTPDPAPTPEPQVAQIDIHVKPGVVTRSRIEGKAKGVIPVVLMSSSTFNAMSVDIKTVTFGKTGTEGRARQCVKGSHDFNNDGRPDLLCHFDNHVSGFEPGDLEAFVSGKTTDGAAFQGRGSLKAMPAKRNQ